MVRAFYFYAAASLIVVAAVPPRVNILPGTHTFTGSTAASKTFTVQLDEPIICSGSPAGGCRVVVNFTSHDPRVSTPHKLMWNVTQNFSSWTDNKTFTIDFNPNAGCDLVPQWTGGGGVNVMDEHVSETNSEYYNGFNPSLEINVPTAPTCDVEEEPLSAGWIFLIVVAAAISLGVCTRLMDI
jgi:hypothetical protein